MMSRHRGTMVVFCIILEGELICVQKNREGELGCPKRFTGDNQELAGELAKMCQLLPCLPVTINRTEYPKTFCFTQRTCESEVSIDHEAILHTLEISTSPDLAIIRVDVNKKHKKKHQSHGGNGQWISFQMARDLYKNNRTTCRGIHRIISHPV